MSALAWLRTSALAATAGFAATALFGLTVGERVLDRAIALEGSAGDAAEALPFTRGEQRAGLALAQLMVAAGVALVLAGIAVLAGVAPEPRRWLELTGGAAFALTVVPAIAVPPLPPGADPGIGVGTRQGLYVLAIALGAGAAYLALRAGRWRGAVVAGAIAAVVALASPGRGETTGVPDGIVRDFQVASVGGQLVFWLVLAGAGAALLRRRRGHARR